MIAIVGATTWGTTLAVAFARVGKPVLLLCRSDEEAETIAAHREHRRRLPGVPLPPSLQLTGDVARLADASVALFSVPSQTMRENVRRVAFALPPNAILLSAAKGLEVATRRRMTEVLAEEAPGHAGAVGALSGPNLSREIAAGMPAATVVAAADRQIAARAQDALSTPALRVYTNSDVIGVELGGALKNVFALVAGMVDGLGLGDNAKASIITRGLAEMIRLGVAAGAQAQTFAGLAGLGDLVATCASNLSRNHQVGLRLAQGAALNDILTELGQVAEGVPTTEAACRLAREYGVELPISEMMRRVLFDGLSVREGANALLSRDLKAEFA